MNQKKRKRKPTRADLVRFIEWAVERAEEEEPRVGGSFLRAVIDDGKALLVAEETQR